MKTLSSRFALAFLCALLAALSARAQNSTAAAPLPSVTTTTPAASTPPASGLLFNDGAKPPAATPSPAALSTVTATSPSIASIASTSAPTDTAVIQRDTLGVSDVKILPALFAQAQQTNTVSALQRLAQSLDSQLIAALGSTRKFQIVARSDLDVVVKEQSLANSGTVVDDASAAKMFRLAGAKYVLTLSLDDFQDRLETATFAALGQQAQRRKVTLSTVVKIYSAQTGKLLESVNLQLSDQDIRNDPNYIVDRGGQWAERLPVDLARLAAEKIAQRVTDILYPAKVLAKTGNQITLNRGEGTGIAVGQVWTVYAGGKVLIDPDTGENLGVEEVAIGKAKITNVTARTATADLSEDRGVTTANIARQTQ